MLFKLLLGLFATTSFVEAIKDITRVGSPLEQRYPFLISLQDVHDSANPPYTFQHCGGAIISEKYAITSADCFSNANIEHLIAETTDLVVGGTLHIITEIHIHPEYQDRLSDANIAIVKVSPSFDFGPRVKPIVLETKELPSVVPVAFAGWGVVENNVEPYKTSYTSTVRDINLMTISNKHCNDYELKVTDRQICTLTRMGQGICELDNGGPLILQNAIKTAIGIATRRYSCGNGFPDIYTKVSPFVEWINATCKCI